MQSHYIIYTGFLQMHQKREGYRKIVNDNGTANSLFAVHGQQIKSICFVQMTRDQRYEMAGCNEIVENTRIVEHSSTYKVDPSVQALI